MKILIIGEKDVIYAQKTINKLCNISEKHRAYKIDIDNYGK